MKIRSFHPQLHSELGASLGYVRLCLKTKQRKSIEGRKLRAGVGVGWGDGKSESWGGARLGDQECHLS